MSYSSGYYRCPTCHQVMLTKGWGPHINGSVCAKDAAIYEQGFKAATSMMRGKLNQVLVNRVKP